MSEIKPRGMFIAVGICPMSYADSGLTSTIANLGSLLSMTFFNPSGVLTFLPNRWEEYLFEPIMGC